jgi:hypothetical protein
MKNRSLIIIVLIMSACVVTVTGIAIFAGVFLMLSNGSRT